MGSESLSTEARAIADLLGLVPHPEGGYYRETFRAPLAWTPPYTSPPAARSASTAIYFLLPAGTFSAWHRIRSDEVWNHYRGAALEIHTLNDGGEHTVHLLGADVERGQRPQAVVPAGLLQGARPVGEGYALVGCTVAPGFDFADFEMPGRAALTRRFPRHRALIEALTRDDARPETG